MLPKRKEIRQPLLSMLAGRGGSARPKDLYAPLAEQFRLSSADLAETCGGDSKWQALVREARDYLVEQGLVHPATPKHRGVWTLTDKGRRMAEG